MEETEMIARVWRGWTAVESADEVAATLGEEIVARYTAAPGNISAHMLRRPLGGGVELMIWSLWESVESMPPGVDENHRLLVARDTAPACWELVEAAHAVAAAA
jgi:hypothetical protein